MSYKKMSLNMFKTKIIKFRLFYYVEHTNRTYNFFNVGTFNLVVNPLTANFFNLNFHPLEVVSR